MTSSSALFRGGSGEPVVLLHGATGSWHHWRPTLHHLTQRYDVIVPTLAGHLGGPAFDDRSTRHPVVQLADHVEHQLDQLGVPTAHVVGNSLGGLVALELASRHRARSACVFSPAGGWDRASREPVRLARFFQRSVVLCRQPGVRLALRHPGLRKSALRDVMRYGDRLTHAEAVTLARATAGCTLASPLVEALRRGDDVVPFEPSAVAIPVVLGWGDRDRVLPVVSCSSRWRRELREVHLYRLRDCGHVPMWDNPHLVVRTIHASVRAAALPAAAGK